MKGEEGEREERKAAHTVNKGQEGGIAELRNFTVPFLGRGEGYHGNRAP